MRLDEYISYLFPDGSYWGEVRDMLLIYIYEKLHDLNIREEEIPENDIAETEEPAEVM